jgi:hypothetical protein
MRWSDVPIILVRTPYWAWLVLGALVALGLLQSRTRRVTPRRLFALPLVLCALGLYTVWPVFAHLPLIALAWVVAVGTGAGLRLWLAGSAPGVQTGAPANSQQAHPAQHAQQAQWSADGRHLQLPGSWAPMVLMLSVFFLRYVSAVAQAMHPALQQLVAFQLPLALGFGGLTGVLLGRSLAYMRGRPGFGGAVAPAVVPGRP